MTKLCQQIWKTQEWPEMLSKSLIITIPKKGDLKKCANYRKISLICHARNIILRIIINRMNPQSEENRQDLGKRETPESIYYIADYWQITYRA